MWSLLLSFDKTGLFRFPLSEGLLQEDIYDAPLLPPSPLLLLATGRSRPRHGIWCVDSYYQSSRACHKLAQMSGASDVVYLGAWLDEAFEASSHLPEVEDDNSVPSQHPRLYSGFRLREMGGFWAYTGLQCVQCLVLVQRHPYSCSLD